MTDSGARRRDWDGVARDWAARTGERLWRDYADELHLRLLAGSLSGATVHRALKTDAFEEVAGERGLHRALQAAANTVTTIDLSTVMLGQARRRHPELRPVAASVARLPIRDGAFDVVLSTSTLDHLECLEDVAAAFAELSRVLRPGGRLILTIDNRANPVIALRSVLPQRWLLRSGLIPYPVGANCGPDVLAGLATGAGLGSVEVGSLMHCPRLPAILLCRLAERLGSTRARAGLLRAMLGAEGLSARATRFRTGYFLTLVASKPQGDRGPEGRDLQARRAGADL